MQLGMIGLGRMGGNMVRRLMRAGHEVIVYSATAKTRETFAKETGAFVISSIAEFVGKLKPPRVVWLMVPAAAVDKTLYQRFSSRGEDDFARKVLSAMRFGFGGHLEKPAK
jgi:6-phosphogluconate dehydrogenase